MEEVFCAVQIINKKGGDKLIITLNCKLLGINDVKIKKGENAGKTFQVAHFYDGDSLHKISIPDEYKHRIANFVGKDITIECTLNLETKKMYFKGIA